MKKWIMAIDQGTSSTRCVLFDDKGEPAYSSQMEFEQIYPQTSWVEHDPEQIFNSVKTVCQQVLKQAKAKADEVFGIGITNQRETTVVWNRKSGEVLYNAIVWQDRRTAQYCENIDVSMKDKIWQKTGLIVDPYFSASKIRWILDQNPEYQKQAEKGELCFGTIDCYLLFKLTDGLSFKTDITNASRTMLFNIKTKQWDEELLAFFNIPKQMLAQVCDNNHEFGITKIFGEDISILSMAGDQHAAMIGQACFKKGQVKSTYGTGCFMMSQLGKEFCLSKNKLLTTIAFQFDGDTHYALEGSIFMAGATMQWLRDNLNIIDDASNSESIAKKIGEDNPVILVPAFVGLGAPFWKADATASIFGMTRGSNKNHIITAGLQACVYQTYDLLKSMEQDSAQTIDEIKVDGGMVNNNWMMQFLANMTQSNIQVPKNTETTAQGIAYAVMLKLGLFSTLDDIQKQYHKQNEFNSNMDKQLRIKLLDRWNSAISKVL